MSNPLKSPDPLLPPTAMRLVEGALYVILGLVLWFVVVMVATLLSAAFAPVEGQEPVFPPEHRAGICALNTGQLVREDSSFVRAGNSGWDYGCIWTQLDISGSGGLYAGITFAPTVIFSWEKIAPDDEISRYSWRPGYHDEPTGEKRRHREDRAYWIITEVGYLFPDRELNIEFRPHVGLIWLTDLGYRFGAPWGPDIPYVGGDLLVPLGFGFYVGANLRLAYKRAHGLTVLEDWAGHHSGPDWTPHAKWIQTVEAKIGVAF